jgi:hypothetical protein
VKKVWMYTVAASKDPNRIWCRVPWRVDDDLIFFGPCKKRIRESLREQYLRPDNSHAIVTDDLYIVGINGGNTQRDRKVVWWGKLTEVMTFAHAHERLCGARFQGLRSDQSSPLHVRPLIENGILIGYEHISDEHIRDNEWVGDLVSRSSLFKDNLKERKLVIQQGYSWEVFDRDCCMLLLNGFFASGQGVAFDDESLEILRQAQPEKSRIDKYAVFGRTANDRANGLRGTYLPIVGELADRFVAWLENRSLNASKKYRSGGYGHAQEYCAQ